MEVQRLTALKNTTISHVAADFLRYKIKSKLGMHRNSRPIYDFWKPKALTVWNVFAGSFIKEEKSTFAKAKETWDTLSSLDKFVRAASAISYR